MGKGCRATPRPAAARLWGGAGLLGFLCRATAHPAAALVRGGWRDGVLRKGLSASGTLQRGGIMVSLWTK